MLEACGGDEATVKGVCRSRGFYVSDPRDLPVIYPPGSLYLTDSELRSHTGAVYTPRDLADQVVARQLSHRSSSHRDPSIPKTGQRGVIRPPEANPQPEGHRYRGGQRRLFKLVRPGTWPTSCGKLDAKMSPAGTDLTRSMMRGRPSMPVGTCSTTASTGWTSTPWPWRCPKLSLWLVTLDKNRPFGFLDDRLAVGDSLLGLTSTEQLLTWLHLPARRGAERILNHEQLCPSGPLTRRHYWNRPSGS